LQALNETEDLLDKFISQQKEAGDACSARLLESKRALDGMLAELKSLATQVDGHEEVLETETENLNVTQIAIAAEEAEYEASIAECERLVKEAKADIAQYAAELEELEQIAKPKVRYEHTVKVDSNSSPRSQVGTPRREGLDSQELPCLRGFHQAALSTCCAECHPRGLRRATRSASEGIHYGIP